MSTEPAHILSLGAGVQSSCLALMAALGEITPMPIAGIFADTQNEPANVYEWLNWLEKQLPFPVHRVTAGNLAEKALIMRQTKDGRLYTSSDIPMFTKAADGTLGKIRNRACTRDFKLKPIFKKQRELGGIKRGQKTIGVINWIGISIDEIPRMKDSREVWCQNRWPLVEKRMSRTDCLNWMAAHNYPKPPRSACTFCPYHNNAEWRRLKTEAPADFQKAVEFERALQKAKGARGNFRSMPFLHRSCVPIDQVDFSTEEEKGQGNLNLFLEECEGACGH